MLRVLKKILSIEGVKMCVYSNVNTAWNCLFFLSQCNMPQTVRMKNNFLWYMHKSDETVHVWRIWLQRFKLFLFCFCLKIFVIPAMFATFELHHKSKALSASHQFIAEVYGTLFILVFLISTLFHVVCLIHKFR